MTSEGYNAEPTDGKFVCVPCRDMIPARRGELTVPGDAADPVWCPWCGDKMDRYDPQIHGEGPWSGYPRTVLQWRGEDDELYRFRVHCSQFGVNWSITMETLLPDEPEWDRIWATEASAKPIFTEHPHYE